MISYETGHFINYDFSLKNFNCGFPSGKRSPQSASSSSGWHTPALHPALLTSVQSTHRDVPSSTLSPLHGMEGVNESCRRLRAGLIFLVTQPFSPKMLWIIYSPSGLTIPEPLPHASDIWILADRVTAEQDLILVLMRSSPTRKENGRLSLYLMAIYVSSRKRFCMHHLMFPLLSLNFPHSFVGIIYPSGRIILLWAIRIPNNSSLVMAFFCFVFFVVSF